MHLSPYFLQTPGLLVDVDVEVDVVVVVVEVDVEVDPKVDVEVLLADVDVEVDVVVVVVEVDVEVDLEVDVEVRLLVVVFFHQSILSSSPLLRASSAACMKSSRLRSPSTESPNSACKSFL